MCRFGRLASMIAGAAHYYGRMVAVADGTPATIRKIAAAEGYVASICFKTGPPTTAGVELEWTVHHLADPARPIDVPTLRGALGPYAPTTVDEHSPQRSLANGGKVTVEPGGQVEVSTLPQRSLRELRRCTDEDTAQLTGLLATGGLGLGDTGIDPFRHPQPVLSTPRYRAMAQMFDRRGPHGRTMMHSTAGLQICVDAGEPDRYRGRWEALHALGPVLIASFANARQRAGRPTGWASARMGTWLSMDPALTGPAWPSSSPHDDPATVWARYALAAPLVCLRRGDRWTAPAGVTFADWVHGALPEPPTIDDLDYHLTTLFPPVRPRGYIEVRYLDTQPPGEWIAPAAVLDALLADQSTLDAAREACGPTEGQWLVAARDGLADPGLRRAARAVLDLALRALDRTDLEPATRDAVIAIINRRLARERTAL